MIPRRTRLAGLVRDLSASPFTAAAAHAAGISANDLTRLVADGTLSWTHHGVLVAGPSDELVDRVRAAGLVLPPGAAIGRRTAAELLGIDPRTPAERGTNLPIECLVPRGATPLRRPGLRAFSTDLLDAEIDGSGGFPLTTPARTAADLLRWLPPHLALAVLDVMAARDLVPLDDVAAILDRWDGHRFVARARRLLAAVEPLAESYGESWLRLRILDAGFPPPQAQIRLCEDGREIYRIDLGYPELRIGFEYDGEEFHDELQPDDARRRAGAEARFGWYVLGFRKNLVLGPSLALERGIGALLGMDPAIRRREW